MVKIIQDRTRLENRYILEQITEDEEKVTKQLEQQYRENIPYIVGFKVCYIICVYVPFLFFIYNILVAKRDVSGKTVIAVACCYIFGMICHLLSVRLDEKSSYSSINAGSYYGVLLYVLSKVDMQPDDIVILNRDNKIVNIRYKNTHNYVCLDEFTFIGCGDEIKILDLDCRIAFTEKSNIEAPEK